VLDLTHDVILKRVPNLDLVKGWKSQRINRDSSLIIHKESGIKFNIWIDREEEKFLIQSNTSDNKVIKVNSEKELEQFLFKMMCLVDNYCM
jgi:hypothetical protein